MTQCIIQWQDRKRYDMMIITTITVNENYEFNITNNHIQNFDKQREDKKKVGK